MERIGPLLAIQRLTPPDSREADLRTECSIGQYRSFLPFAVTCMGVRFRRAPGRWLLCVNVWLLLLDGITDRSTHFIECSMSCPKSFRLGD
jgi:hypothetical protein